LNKAYAGVGMWMTFTFYCPSCAEGGCSKSAPKREAICKQGTCARRDTERDEPNAPARVVDNRPADVERARDGTLSAAVFYRACMRYAGCAKLPAKDCDSMRTPFDDPAAKDCFAAIDQMECVGTFSFTTLEAVSKLPACTAVLDTALAKGRK